MSSNQIRFDPPRQSFDPVYVLFRRSCMQHPEHIAIECGEQKITYAHLQDQVRAIGALLLAHGVGEGQVVAIHGQRSACAIASTLAAWSIGATVTMIDAAIPEERRRLMLTTVSVGAILHWGTPFELRGVLALDVREAIQDRHEPESAHGDAKRSFPGDRAYIAFTSGSTGRPKAIAGSHNGLAHFVDWQSKEFGIGPGDRLAHFTNLSFDVWFRDVFTPLISGATICIPTSEARAEFVFAFLRDSAITAMHLVPSIANLWINTHTPATTIDTLKHAFFAGEPLEGTLIRKWRDAFPQCTVVNLYGPTETTLAKHFKRIGADVVDGIQSVGLNLPGSMTYITADDGHLCEHGETGEICIATPYRSHGYLIGSELVSTFLEGLLPELTNLPIYRTGDLGRRNAEGEIEILGRKDDQIKINGVRIDLLEVKSVIASHPSVRDAFVCARQGRFTKSIVAFIESEERSEETFLAYLRKRLPDVMIPSQLHFRDVLPRLPNGKTDRKSLTEFANRPTSVAPVRPPEQPHSTAEQVEAIWSEILAYSGLHPTLNFFDAGGNSLLIVALHERIEKHFSLSIPLVRLFRDTTIETQSRMIAALLQGEGAAIEYPAGRSDARVMSRNRIIAARSAARNM
ncbi:non-ribosomal peptide synthetase [Burkholderia sp. Ac-20344]|uniref:non-ribosomal peptide synthetase n=1 Tax=Burkholderia sp. Ac-20344 TaxID=2703890 RepID=UPI00197B5946|nr:non-ribosomal peptide synthetase [Burkholderia sp. Ac-20344]MBN3833395.1 non-ribosomal peptide synthetase [Burkholderia sp. Ac-20344]